MADNAKFCRAGPLKDSNCAGEEAGTQEQEPSSRGLRGLDDSKEDNKVLSARTTNPEPVRPTLTEDETDAQIQRGIGDIEGLGERIEELESEMESMTCKR